MRLDPASTPLKLVLLTVLNLCLFFMLGPRLMRQQGKRSVCTSRLHALML